MQDDLLTIRTTPPSVQRRWRVTMAVGEVRTVEAVTFRVEGGALVLVLPVGCAAAYAPGTWLSIEPVPAP
jgi:hypothetical protein